MKKYGWRLTDAVSGSVIMDTITQKQIYGITDDISCVCNGLMNKSKYILELYVETQNGYFDVLQSMAFYVNYPVKSLEADFEVVALNETAGIMLNWGNLRTTEGIVFGNEVDYNDSFPVASSSSIEIPECAGVIFSDNANGKGLDIDENSYIVLSFQFNKIYSTILFEISGEDKYSDNIMRKLEYIAEGNALKYTVVKGDMISISEKSLSNTTGELCWYVTTLYPLVDGVADFKIAESISENGLFSSEELYPTDLYVYDESGNVIDGEYNKASENYDPNLTYFYLVDGDFVKYTYNETTWNSDYINLYCCLYPYFGEWVRVRN